MAGWMLGHYAYEGVAKPVLEFYGKLDEFEALVPRDGSATGFILLMLVTSGLAHLPPIKVVTILAGVISFPLGWFILSAIIARGARFLFLAWLLAPLRRADQAFHRGAPGAACRSRGGRPYSALLARKIFALIAR